MRVIFETPKVGEEDKIIFQCSHITPEFLQILDVIKSSNKTLGTSNKILVRYIDKTIHRIAPADIYYIKSTGNKAFIYSENKVYTSKMKLYELQDLLLNDSFMRISKSTIVNLSKIKSIASGASGRLDATLLNDGKVIVSRQYVKRFKQLWMV